MEEKKFYKLKKNRKYSENIHLNLQNSEKNNKNIIIQKRISNILFPNKILNERKIIPFYFPLKPNISRDNLSSKQYRKLSNYNIYENILNNNTAIEENILLHRPQIQIKIHSLKHSNRNTLPSEKTNSQIKCKVHKIKPKPINNNKIIDLSKSNRKKIQNNKNKNKVNFNRIDINKDILNITEFNKKQNNEEKSFLYFYNIAQEKSLKKLNSHLDNLIGNKNKAISEYEDNNNIYKFEKMKENRFKNIINYSNNNIYRKKVQRKKNNYNENNIPINDNNLLNSGEKNNLNYLNKQDILNIQDENLIKNRLKTKRTQKFICTRNNYQNSNKINYFSNNYKSGNYNYNQNTNSILLTSLSHIKNTNTNNNYNNTNKKTEFSSEIKGKEEKINIENAQNQKLIFNNKKQKSNTINFIEILKHDPYNKKDYLTSKKCDLTEIRHKKHYTLRTPKLSNIIPNSYNLEDFTYSNENTFNFNYFLGKNDINNQGGNKKCITLYSNNTSEYNTVNTLNNSEKNIMKFPCRETNKINLNFKNNNIIKTNKFPFQNSNLSQKKIYIRNELLGEKNISNNNSKNKKLRNVVTSIEYSNRSNKKLNNYLKDKNIIMSEIGPNGKINIKVREMKNSIEKILRENSFNKTRNALCLNSPQKINNILTYVKKNQGTQIRKIKKHNTKDHIDFYPPPIPFQ